MTSVVTQNADPGVTVNGCHGLATGNCQTGNRQVRKRIIRKQSPSFFSV